MCPHKPTTNLAAFSPKGQLGKLFAQAKIYNQINEQLNQELPSTLKTLELCLIKNNIATLITSNPAVAFRAKQQLNELTTIVQSACLSIQIKQIEIKVTTDK